MMRIEEFIASLSDNSPPSGISKALSALWYDAKGDWETAHEIAQNIDSKSGALIHAYLHRKEGDNGNARYWYSSADAKFPSTTLDEEWREIVNLLLS
jgi:hypothetical protein